MKLNFNFRITHSLRLVKSCRSPKELKFPRVRGKNAGRAIVILNFVLNLIQYWFRISETLKRVQGDRLDVGRGDFDRPSGRLKPSIPVLISELCFLYHPFEIDRVPILC